MSQNVSFGRFGVQNEKKRWDVVDLLAVFEQFVFYLILKFSSGADVM